MSKGTPIVQFRLPPQLAAEVMETIERRNRHSRGKPWDRTGFLLAVIRRELTKMARSRRRSPRRRERRTPATPTPQ